MTLVAAEETVRGVTAVARPVLRAAVVRPVVRPVLRAAVVRVAVRRAALVVPLAPVVLVPVVLVPAASAVAFLVGGTDLLPPIWISHREGHSTESNVLHI